MCVCVCVSTVCLSQSVCVCFSVSVTSLQGSGLDVVWRMCLSDSVMSLMLVECCILGWQGGLRCGSKHDCATLSLYSSVCVCDSVSHL